MAENETNPTLPTLGREIGHVDYLICPILAGYPPFSKVLTQATGWNVALMLMNTFMVAIIMVIFIQEGFYMYTYFRKRKSRFPRHQRKLIFLQASVPFVLSFSALIINLAPRVHMIVSAFTTTYFAFCLNGFARMIFDYLGGIRSTAKFLREKEATIDYKAAPLTCCCVCLPTPVPSIKSLKVMRLGVLQVVPISIVVTFLTPAIILDGSVCVDGKMPVNGLNSSPFVILTIVDLLSTMVAVTSLTALAKNTKEFLTEYKVSQKFAVFKLALIFFRIQPSILNAMAGWIGHLRPLRPFYSDEAYTMTFNGQLQIIEFFIISIILRVIYEKTLQEQNNIRSRASRNWRKIAFLSHNSDCESEDGEQEETQDLRTFDSSLVDAVRRQNVEQNS